MRYIPVDEWLKHACPACGQAPNRRCISITGRNKGMTLYDHGRPAPHSERRDLARASLPPERPKPAKLPAKPHAWRSSACLPRREP